MILVLDIISFTAPGGITFLEQRKAAATFLGSQHKLRENEHPLRYFSTNTKK